MHATAEAIARTIAPAGLMTTIEAAAYLNIKAATLAVWRSTNRRTLTYVKVGGQVRYRREDLDRFITDNLCNAA